MIHISNIWRSSFLANDTWETRMYSIQKTLYFVLQRGIEPLYYKCISLAFLVCILFLVFYSSYWLYCESDLSDTMRTRSRVRLSHFHSQDPSPSTGIRSHSSSLLHRSTSDVFLIYSSMLWLCGPHFSSMARV